MRIPSFLAAAALLAGLGAGGFALAQDTAPAHAASALPAASKSNAAEASRLDQDNRNCLRSTGSLIPPKNGGCVPATSGHSYSRDDLRRTGTNDNARALQMLDPSISVGH